VDELVTEIAAARRRAVARAISQVEEGGESARLLLTRLRSHIAQVGASVHVIGLTGPPGAGKSSLSDQLIFHLRSLGKRVAVLAVDPSSPFTGGAVLGDRVRMNRHATDPAVFIRSMGTRGAAGGLAKPVRDAATVLTAAAFDVILIETVGVGQSELDVMFVADTVAVILTPAGGDHIQTAKAGIMEIGDLFVVNKSDLPGAGRTAKDIQDMLHIRTGRAKSAAEPEEWAIPVILTSTFANEGTDLLWKALQGHFDYLVRTERLNWRRGRGRVRELRELLERQVAGEVERRWQNDALWLDLQSRVQGDRLPVAAAVDMALQSLLKD